MSANSPTYDINSLKPLTNLAPNGMLVSGNGRVLSVVAPTLPPGANTWVIHGSHFNRVEFHSHQPADPHPWLSADGMVSYMRIMRGEEKLPHLPTDCNHCHEIFRRQVSFLRDNKMGHGLGPGKRHKENPGRMKMQIRLQKIRERLQVLARINSMEGA